MRRAEALSITAIKAAAEPVLPLAIVITAAAGTADKLAPQQQISAWLLQERGAEILRELAKRCDKAAIPVLPVKGVITSRLLYGDPADRPMADVDVRVRPRDFARFRRMAAAAGWRCVRTVRSYHNLIYDFGGLSLDVEAHVGPPGLCSLSVDLMLDRAERREILPGLRVYVPEVHDHAVLLTVNVFKDKIVTASPWAIADLERVIIQPSFRRDLFVERARESFVATITWTVAAWMESFRKSEAWAAIRVAIESRTKVRRGYARFLQRQLAMADPASMSLRLLARVGADVRRMQLEALLRAMAYSAEIWIRGFAVAKR